MWTIYYGDGDTFSSDDGGPDVAPAQNVQVIVQYAEQSGWYLQVGSDYYIWSDGRWVGVDLFGVWDYCSLLGWKRVLLGRMLSNDQFNEVYQRAKADRDLLIRGGK